MDIDLISPPPLGWHGEQQGCPGDEHGQEAAGSPSGRKPAPRAVGEDWDDEREPDPVMGPRYRGDEQDGEGGDQLGIDKQMLLAQALDEPRRNDDDK